MRENRDADAPCGLYPLFMRLEGEPVVVVGGGAVAERKATELVRHGASVTVVAPDVTDFLRAHAHAGTIAWKARRYRQGDLEGAMLVVCATGERESSEAVYAEARSTGTPVNVVDIPGLCTAIVPSTLRRGRLQIAVSTGGASPSTAREIRESLENVLPSWWGPYLDALADLRAMVKERVPGPASVREPLYEALRESDLRERVATGEMPDAEELYARVVEPLVASHRTGTAS